MGSEMCIRDSINLYGENHKKSIDYIVYGECQDIVINKDIKHFINIKEAMHQLNDFSFTPGILVFTASDSDGPYAMNYFSSLFSKL